MAFARGHRNRRRCRRADDLHDGDQRQRAGLPQLHQCEPGRQGSEQTDRRTKQRFRQQGSGVRLGPRRREQPERRSRNVEPAPQAPARVGKTGSQAQRRRVSSAKPRQMSARPAPRTTRETPASAISAPHSPGRHGGDQWRGEQPTNRAAAETARERKAPNRTSAVMIRVLNIDLHTSRVVNAFDSAPSHDRRAGLPSGDQLFAGSPETTFAPLIRGDGVGKG